MRAIYGLMISALVALFLLVGVWVLAALSQHTHEGEVGRFYQSWRMPYPRANNGDRIYGCCNKHDCYQTQFRRGARNWEALHRETGRWVVVPDMKLEHNATDPRDSPDGLGHLCASTSGNVYCAVLGMEG